MVTLVTPTSRRPQQRPLIRFAPGSLVGWSKDVSPSWYFIWTPGPMKVISFRYTDGSSSEFLKKFEEQFGGEPNKSGWIVTVEYDPDSTTYYDPPRSLLFHKKVLQMEVHEMWLVPWKE